jgi:hypothetical protein
MTPEVWLVASMARGANYARRIFTHSALFLPFCRFLGYAASCSNSLPRSRSLRQKSVLSIALAAFTAISLQTPPGLLGYVSRFGVQSTLAKLQEAGLQSPGQFVRGFPALECLSLNQVGQKLGVLVELVDSCAPAA